jgi:hypothetical protein
VKGSSLETGKQNMLVRPIGPHGRLKILSIRRTSTKESKDRRDFKSEMTFERFTSSGKKSKSLAHEASHKLMDRPSTRSHVQLQRPNLGPDDPSA